MAMVSPGAAASIASWMDVNPAAVQSWRSSSTESVAADAAGAANSATKIAGRHALSDASAHDENSPMWMMRTGAGRRPIHVLQVARPYA